MNVPYIEKKQLTITIAIQFHSWILKEFLVMDFCSEYFSEIYLTYLLPYYLLLITVDAQSLARDTRRFSRQLLQVLWNFERYGRHRG